MKLVLFDIDGTLVDLFSVHDKAFKKTLLDLYGVKGSLFDVDFSGDTLDNVVISIAKKHGLGEKEVEVKRKLITREYFKRFEGELERGNIKVLPGIEKTG